MELKTLLLNAGIDCPQYSDIKNITKIVSDSRKACEGCLYVCIKGIHQDGHLFIRDALQAGALAIVVQDGACFDEGINESAIVISVAQTRRTLACLFNVWHGNPAAKMKFIAVTGTNGKTSVTHILKRIFEVSLYRCGLIGTVSCLSIDRRLISDNGDKLANMTTPDPEQLYGMLAEMADDGVEYVFIEASSHALALNKLAPIKFVAAVFTNITPEHFDFHGNMANYLAAKKKLFDMTDLAIINKDSEYYSNVVLNLKCNKIISCSEKDETADYKAAAVTSQGIDGVEYVLNSHRGILKIKSKLPGGFNVMNTLEAAACALELGIRPTIVSQAIASITGINGRLEKIDVGVGADFSVFIDYAHTPDALENVLNSVNRFKKPDQKVKLLFGCGGDRDKLKRPIMGEIATRLSDFVIITSDNCRSEEPQKIISDILSGVQGRSNYIVITDRAEAIENIILNAEYGDIIILAGKGHESYDISRAGRVPFSEKQIVMAAIKKRDHV